MLSVVELSDFQSPIPRDGHDYWLGKKSDRAIPARRDFDPLLEVPRLCRNIMLLDVKHDPLDFRYRLIGSNMRAHMRENWTGRWWSEIAFQRPPNPIWEPHRWVVEHRAPRFIRPNYVGPHQEFLFIESAVLPLGNDPDSVDMLMIFADFISKTKR